MTEVPDGFSNRQGVDIGIIGRYARPLPQERFRADLHRQRVPRPTPSAKCGDCRRVCKERTREPRPPLHRRHHHRLHRSHGVRPMGAIQGRRRELPIRSGRPAVIREAVADLHRGCPGRCRGAARSPPHARQHGQAEPPQAARARQNPPRHRRQAPSTPRATRRAACCTSRPSTEPSAGRTR